jgi:hypothetical protein
MNGFASRPDGDGIPLLTEVVDLTETPAADPEVPSDATASVAPPGSSMSEQSETMSAASMSIDMQAQPFHRELPQSPAGMALSGNEAASPPAAAEDILQQFRATWPAIIEAECQEAVHATLRQFSDQLVETLSVHLTITLQARLETWLEARLRS